MRVSAPPFSAAVRGWFESSFDQPTPAQSQGWQAIAGGDHTLILAPTGSGKTLAAFLWAIDRLSAQPPPEPDRRTRVLYISPLRALAVDVEKNLRSPLAGIQHAAAREGVTLPHDPQVGVRTGDTPARDRRRLIAHPPDILITTPESLYLMLTSSARETLRSVTTVIVDEIHALAATKRGAHLALSLERLDALADSPPQRIGLSATQRPLDEIARFLGGHDVDAEPSPGDDRRRGTSQTHGAGGHRPDRGHGTDRPGHGHARQRSSRLRRPGPRIDLARDPPEAPGADQSAPVHDRVRQRSPARRTTRGAAQRTRRRRPRPHPSWVDRSRATTRDRRRAQIGLLACHRRHEQPRTRHRHGRGGPGGPGRVAGLGRQRPAADRASGSPGR